MRYVYKMDSLSIFSQQRIVKRISIRIVLSPQSIPYYTHPHSLRSPDIDSPIDQAMACPRNVAVIIGIGGIGLAAARRLGSGRLLFLADEDLEALQTAKEKLIHEGYSVMTHEVDIRQLASVRRLAIDAATINAGHIDAIVASAGVAPICQFLFHSNTIPTLI